jgi:hypothetical protein
MIKSLVIESLTSAWLDERERVILSKFPSLSHSSKDLDPDPSFNSRCTDCSGSCTGSCSGSCEALCASGCTCGVIQ